VVGHGPAEGNGEMAERTRERLKRKSNTMSSSMLLVSAGHESFMQCFGGTGRGKEERIWSGDRMFGHNVLENQ
jgi:hypothetical protein